MKKPNACKLNTPGNPPTPTTEDPKAIGRELRRRYDATRGENEALPGRPARWSDFEPGIRRVLGLYEESERAHFPPVFREALIALTTDFYIRFLHTRVPGKDEQSVRRAWGSTRAAMPKVAALIGDHGPVVQLALITMECLGWAEPVD